MPPPAPPDDHLRNRAYPRSSSSSIRVYSSVITPRGDTRHRPSTGTPAAERSRISRPISSRWSRMPTLPPANRRRRSSSPSIVVLSGVVVVVVCRGLRRSDTIRMRCGGDRRRDGRNRPRRRRRRAMMLRYRPWTTGGSGREAVSDCALSGPQRKSALRVDSSNSLSLRPAASQSRFG